MSSHRKIRLDEKFISIEIGLTETYVVGQITVRTENDFYEVWPLDYSFVEFSISPPPQDQIIVYDNFLMLQRIYAKHGGFPGINGELIEVDIVSGWNMVKKFNQLEKYGFYNPFDPKSIRAWIKLQEERGDRLMEIKKKL